MKKLLYIFTKAVFTLLALSAQALPALALTVNMETAQTDDIIIFEIHASGCPQEIVGMDFAVTYDESVMQYVDGSLESDVLSDAVVNTNLESQIKLAWIDYTLSGIDLSYDTVLVSLEFAVVGNGSDTANITYEMGSFIGADYTEYEDIYTYSVTEVVSSSERNSVSSTAASSDTDISAQETSDTHTSESDTVSDSDTDDSTAEDTSTDTGDNSDTPESTATMSDGSSAEQDEPTETSTYDTANSPDSAATTATPDSATPMSTGIAAFVIVAAVIIVVGIVFFTILFTSKRGKHMR